MSNRMGVLSRRLRLFAFGFSFATFASFLVGMISTSGMIPTGNITGREIAFFFAGLGSLCFFAALLLWMAYGFAWAMVPVKPAEERQPVQERALASGKAAEEYKPLQEYKPLRESKAAESKAVVEY